MNCSRQKTLTLFLVAALLFATIFGCTSRGTPGEQQIEHGDLIDLEVWASEPLPALAIDQVAWDGRLTLAYVAGDTLNPYTTQSRDNLSVTGLLYEGLYALGANFTAIPMLIDELSTEDGQNFTVRIREGIFFHNGVELTVDDVLYSLDRARQSPNFAARLSSIAASNHVIDEDGEISTLEFTLALNREHGNLPVLLTFPIIQRQTSDWTIPPGTGPFAHPADGGTSRLIAFNNHWHEGELPVQTIHLTQAQTAEQLAAQFDAGRLNIVGVDMVGSGMPRLSGSRDLRHYETSMMDYLGFNLQNDELSTEVRQAISAVIDRGHIANHIMQGAMTATALPIHPALSAYDHALSAEHAYTLGRALAILHGYDEDELDATDDDEDEDEPAPFPLRLLVSADNAMRMETVLYIAEQINTLGFIVTIDERPHERYLEALAMGDFDLFYAQVRLLPDFDLSELLFGSLALGGTDRLIDRAYVDDFLASGMDNRAAMATAMCEAFLEEMPFVVIGFRKLTIVSQRGLIAGLRPTQDNLYAGVFDWQVGA